MNEIEIENRGREGRGSSVGNERNKNKDKDNFDFQGNKSVAFLSSFYPLNIVSLYFHFIHILDYLSCLII